jgi:ATP-binding cassette subfamily F protein uup
VVLLAKILKRGGNVLMLDEPTNDLDLSTLRLLEEALVAFAGCVVVVSHDRYFLNRVCTSILAFETPVRCGIHVGNYDYYLEKRREEAAQFSASAETLAKSPVADAAPARPRKLKWKEARELEMMEETIATAEAEVAQLEKTFAASDFYKRPPEEMRSLETQLTGARARVNELYARWEELAQIEALAQSA